MLLFIIVRPTNTIYANTIATHTTYIIYLQKYRDFD